MKKYLYPLAILGFMALASCTEDVVVDEPNPPFDPPYESDEVVDEKPTQKPTLDAIMVFHNYVSYGDGSSKIHTYDFKTNQLKCISAEWSSRVSDPMNAMFSPDGTEIVFMGIRVDGTPETGKDSWCLFKHTIGSTQLPEVLAPTNARDEDPKYSMDGQKVVFKRTANGIGDVWELNMTANPVTATKKTNAASGTEYSMPFYSADGKYIVVSTTSGGVRFGKIDRIDVATNAVLTLYQQNNVNCYYPIGIDNERFYYSAGYSSNNAHDQIYIGYYNGKASVRMPFNMLNADSSDACPVNDDWVIISSTRSPGAGQYDLWICSTKYAVAFPMSEYNQGINSAGSELGAWLHLRK